MCAWFFLNNGFLCGKWGRFVFFVFLEHVFKCELIRSIVI